MRAVLKIVVGVVISEMVSRYFEKRPKAETSALRVDFDAPMDNSTPGPFLPAKGAGWV